MQPSIHIAEPLALVTDPDALQTAVSMSRSPLAAADVRYWRTEQWALLEQAYDLPDIYLCYIEVETASAVNIPVRCPHHDLYWLYLLKGGFCISGTDGRSHALKTAAPHYRLAYLPPASYTCRFTTGIHRVFYMVYKPAVLFREDSDELNRGSGPLEAVKKLLGIPSISDPLSMADGSSGAIHSFLHAPGSSYLRRLYAIHTLAITLISLGCEALHIRAAVDEVGADLAVRMQRFIDQCVADGDPVDTKLVATHARVSYAYTKAVFKSKHHIAIGSYITRRKLEQAKLLLSAGEIPADVARYICWSYAHFSKTFKARYGISPSDYPKGT